MPVFGERSFSSAINRHSIVGKCVLVVISTGYHTSPLPLSDEEITLICRISPELSGDDHYDVNWLLKINLRIAITLIDRRITITLIDVVDVDCRPVNRRKNFRFLSKTLPFSSHIFSVGVFRPRSRCLFSTNSLTSGLELVPRCRQQTLWVRAFSRRNELDSSVPYSLFFLSTRCVVVVASQSF